MITTQANINVESSEAFKEFSFGIKNSGLPHILGILRNKLYSNKPLAIMREYTCNAVDANVENGKANEPVIVSLPNNLETNFRVRDFGKGLSMEDIAEIYANYGESTKRQSNDYVGCMGIGSKAAFSYGDNFMVISYQDGTKTTYNAYIDPTQVGKIAKMSVEKTDEADGIEIVVPVKPEDIRYFTNTATELFQNFSPRPKIQGQTITFEDEKVELKGSNYEKVAGRGMLLAIMGHIGYEVDESAFMNFYNKMHKDKDGEEYYNSIHRYILHNGFKLFCKIGDLQVAASRESLEYSEHTLKSLYEKVNLIAKDLRDNLEKKILAAPNYYEACSLYQSTYDLCDKVFGKRKPKYGKVEVNSHIKKSDEQNHDYTLESIKGQSTWRRSRFTIRSETVIVIQPNPNLEFMIADCKGAGRRVRKMMKDGHAAAQTSGNGSSYTSQVVLITAGTDINAFEREFGIDPSKLRKASSLPKPTRVVSSTGKITSGAPTGVYEVDVGAIDSYSRPSSYMEAHVLPTKPVIYVEIQNKILISTSGYHNSASTLKSLLIRAKELNGNKDIDELYAVNTAKVPKLPSGSIELKEWIKKKSEEKVAHLDLKDLFAKRKALTLCEKAGSLLEYIKPDKLTDKSGMMAMFLNEYLTIKKEVDAVSSLLANIKEEDSKTAKLHSLVEDYRSVVKEYPMLFIAMNRYYGIEKSEQAHMVDYVNLVDAK